MGENFEGVKCIVHQIYNNRTLLQTGYVYLSLNSYSFLQRLQFSWRKSQQQSLSSNS